MISPPRAAGPGWAIWYPADELSAHWRPRISRIERNGSPIPVTDTPGVDQQVEELVARAWEHEQQEMWARIALGLGGIVIGMLSAVGAWVIDQTLDFSARIQNLEEEVKDVHHFHKTVSDRLEIPAPLEPSKLVVMEDE